jgi:hypothetical protein
MPVKIISSAETFHTKGEYAALDSITTHALAWALWVEGCPIFDYCVRNFFLRLLITPVPEVSNEFCESLNYGSVRTQQHRKITLYKHPAFNSVHKRVQGHKSLLSLKLLIAGFDRGSRRGYEKVANAASCTGLPMKTCRNHSILTATPVSPQNDSSNCYTSITTKWLSSDSEYLFIYPHTELWHHKICNCYLNRCHGWITLQQTETYSNVTTPATPQDQKMIQ